MAIFIILNFICSGLIASNEDTVFVQSHFREHWSWYGTIDKWAVFNQAGDTKLKRNQLEGNKYYRDTLDLMPGCYQFQINDTGFDGLTWWANPGQGTGSVVFAKVAPEVGIIKSFNSDFGCKTIHNFNVVNNSNINDYKDNISIIVYPNPSKGNFSLILSSGKNENAMLTIVNMLGETIYNKTISILDNVIYNLSLEDEKPGVYILKINTEGRSFVKQLIID